MHLTTRTRSFDGWTYQNGIDTNTTGNVLFQSRSQAMQEQLTYVNPAGRAVIKVDNTTDGHMDPTFGRPSVKLLSNATVSQGSLTILDAVHMPFGVRAILSSFNEDDPPNFYFSLCIV